MKYYIKKPPLGSQIDWSHPLSTGIVGYWLFNEGSGNKINDISNNRNIGTLTNFDLTTAWKSSPLGKSLDFDGSNDYINCGNKASLNFTRGVTVDIWLKASSFAANRVIIYRGTLVFAQGDYQITQLSNTIYWRLNQDALLMSTAAP